jgi:hypothetical protein
MTEATMRGVYLPGGRRTVLRDVPIPAPSPGQVLLAVGASTICGSDVRAIYRDRRHLCCDRRGGLDREHQCVHRPGASGGGRRVGRLQLLRLQRNNFLRGASLSNGVTVWTKSGAWQPQAGDRATGAGKHVYATDTSTGKIYNLNPANGVRRSRVAGAKAVLAVDGSRIYTTCGSATGQVCGYAPSSGLQEWNVTTGVAVSLGAFAGGVLYLGNGKALRASSGATIKTLWSGQASSLVVGDGRICAVVTAQKLNVYGLSNA